MSESHVVTAPGLPSKHNRLIFWGLLGFFLLSLVGTAIFGSIVVSRARQDAATADESVRLSAWWCLLYADQHGRFPTSWEELAKAAWRERLESVRLTTPPVDWPLDTVKAGVSGVADPTGPMRLAKGSATVRFPVEGSGGVPVVSGDGRPTYVGTIEEVNGWLKGAEGRVREGG